MVKAYYYSYESLSITSYCNNVITPKENKPS